jgi:hypothetical protein
MFSNNYTPIFELLGGNQIFNNFNESTIEETKAEILANIPLITDAECDESTLEGPLRCKNSNSSFSLHMAKAQTSMYDASKGKRKTITHLDHRMFHFRHLHFLTIVRV